MKVILTIAVILMLFGFVSQARAWQPSYGDFDGDGVPDSEDNDIDGDGVFNEQDPNDYNPDIPFPGTGSLFHYWLPIYGDDGTIIGYNHYQQTYLWDIFGDCYLGIIEYITQY